MQELSTGIAAGGRSEAFRTTSSGEVWIDIRSATASQPVTLEYSHDNENFVSMRADGVDQDLTTDNLKVYWLPGGIYLRVSVGATATDVVDCRVDGHGVKLFE